MVSKLQELLTNYEEDRRSLRALIEEKEQ